MVPIRHRTPVSTLYAENVQPWVQMTKEAIECRNPNMAKKCAKKASEAFERISLARNPSKIIKFQKEIKNLTQSVRKFISDLNVEATLSFVNTERSVQKFIDNKELKIAKNQLVFLQRELDNFKEQAEVFDSIPHYPRQVTGFEGRLQAHSADIQQLEIEVEIFQQLEIEEGERFDRNTTIACTFLFVAVMGLSFIL